MKILLVGNYIYGRQQSMLRFGELMRGLLHATGHEVRLLHPAPIFGKLKPGETGLGKWLGYIDRFVLFYQRLRREAAWADVVHICDHANAVYVPALGSKPHVVTCHDLLAIRSALGEFPDKPTGWSGRIYQRWILSGLRRAQHVICVSAQTQAELLRLAALPATRTCVVPNALNYPYRPMARDQACRALAVLGVEASRPFILHVGGNQWYKNREGVVKIFAELVRQPGYENHRLVMAGSPWPQGVREQVRVAGLEGRAHELVDVANEDLRALYSVADAVLFPSLQEGFGWPIVESQACGCPVITTNRRPMTDVAGKGAVFIDPDNPHEAAKHIARSLRERERLCEVGRTNAARYSGQKMIRSYLSAYLEMIHKCTENYTK